MKTCFAITSHIHVNLLCIHVGFDNMLTSTCVYECTPLHSEHIPEQLNPCFPHGHRADEQSALHPHLITFNSFSGVGFLSADMATSLTFFAIFQPHCSGSRMSLDFQVCT